MEMQVSNLKMADLKGRMFLVLLLSSCFMVSQASEPNCLSVRDFGKCLGTSTNFCPIDVECTCKDQKPFCKCPNYRGSRGDYWYMGPKCEHLWNTLDLILVIVFPAVALASIASVIVQWIYYCKNSSRNDTKYTSVRKEARSEIQISKINPAYIPDPHENVRPQQTMDNFNLSYLPMQRIGSHIRETEHNQGPRSSAPVNDYGSPQRQTVFPHLTSKPNTAYNAYSHNHQFDFEDSALPGRDFVARTQQPIQSVYRNPKPKSNVPKLPQEDYEPNAYPSNDPAQWSTRPFGMGRPQVKTHYDY